MENTVRPRTSPRDFFLHLFATAALYFSAVNVINLLRQYVNYFFPDPLTDMSYGFGLSASMRLAVAFLVIIFPAYVVAMWVLGRDVDRTPEKRDIWVRRWAIYLTLFIAGVTILGDLVYLVYSFLGGDLTTRFVLQALAILVVAVVVFAYYIYLLRRSPGSDLRTRRVLAAVSLVLVGALIIGAFFIMGSPSQNRARAFDLQRENDLSNIQGQLVYYWQAKQALPHTLEELADPLSGSSAPRDPETEQPYEYRKTGERSFELCAVFTTENRTDNHKGASVPPPYYRGYLATDENWQHGAERTCFPRTIDPERYPPLQQAPQ